eukprot:CAMPEP_0185163036 /NCGR_PEP_ID=MMETSP1139-20130426/7422_1 /TAXON_ID=298111 /ORGANISM="Pavlova sp., Strain CCMP459" /LENGTH=179 /DNA_ID=CAMNT_0027728385 /DNA_START=352 /DNA_END=892 /DNA_ORIENTATION=-
MHIRSPGKHGEERGTGEGPPPVGRCRLCLSNVRFPSGVSDDAEHRFLLECDERHRACLAWNERALASPAYKFISSSAQAFGSLRNARLLVARELGSRMRANKGRSAGSKASMLARRCWGEGRDAVPRNVLDASRGSEGTPPHIRFSVPTWCAKSGVVALNVTSLATELVPGLWMSMEPE